MYVEEIEVKFRLVHTSISFRDFKQALQLQLPQQTGHASANCSSFKRGYLSNKKDIH